MRIAELSFFALNIYLFHKINKGDILEKINYRLLVETVDKDKAFNIYKNAIISSDKFINEIDETLITIEEGYYIYCFYYGKIIDLEYLAIQNKNNIKGKVDVEYNYYSGDFLLNGLSKKMENNSVDSIDMYRIFNIDDVIKFEKVFIEGLINKAEELISKRHRVVLTDKLNKIDVVPIREFTVFSKEFYIEKVYKIHYVSKYKKKNYVSLISGITGEIYNLEYITSQGFNDFYKKYKSPLVYIPYFLLDDYYDRCFSVYLKTKEELRYISEKELLKKIKDNVENNEHPNYDEYLLEGIFYFKKRGYLKYYKIRKSNNLRITLLDLFLTLYYQKLSGLKLADYYKLGVIYDKSNKQWLKLLDIAYKLGNVEAKKLLYEHYLEPKYYDQYYLKRYS